MMTFGFSQLNLAVSGISGTLCSPMSDFMTKRARISPSAEGWKRTWPDPTPGGFLGGSVPNPPSERLVSDPKIREIYGWSSPLRKVIDTLSHLQWLKCKCCNMLIYLNIYPSLVAWTILKRHKTCPFWCEIPISTHTQPPDLSRPRGIDTNLHTIGASCFGFHLLQWKALENLANCGFLMDIWCVHYINIYIHIWYIIIL